MALTLVSSLKVFVLSTKAFVADRCAYIAKNTEQLTQSFWNCCHGNEKLLSIFCTNYNVFHELNYSGDHWCFNTWEFSNTLKNFRKLPDEFVLLFNLCIKYVSMFMWTSHSEHFYIRTRKSLTNCKSYKVQAASPPSQQSDRLQLGEMIAQDDIWSSGTEGDYSFIFSERLVDVIQHYIL